jgi:asparagine synthase (glutamine-hydrolysing)
VSPEEFFDALPRLVWHEDEPIAFPSSVPLHFVSALAREHVKVVLTGEGADELFGGYNRYRVTAWNQRLGNVYKHLLPSLVRNNVARGVDRLPWRARRYLSRTFLALKSDPRSLYLENFAIFRDRVRRNTLTNQNADPFAELERHYDEATGGILDRMLHTELKTHLVELLMKQDQMSMAASVESRVPFLDHELVEWVVGLPPQSKIRGWQTKVVLREALREIVPHEILTRRKMGFPVPIGRWLRGQFANVADEFVTGARTSQRGLLRTEFVRTLADDHRSGRAEHGTRLWSLLNLEIWHRIFIDGEDVSSIMAPVRRPAVAA